MRQREERGRPQFNRGSKDELYAMLDVVQYERYRAKTFDRELFAEAWDAIAAELKDLSPEERFQVFQDMYFDAVPPSEQEYATRAAQFIDTRITEPVILAVDQLTRQGYGIEGGMISALEGHDEYRPAEYYSRIVQYGPVRMIDVVPGDYAIHDASDELILGSTGFSACQAIVARSEGKVALVHSLFGCESSIPAIVQKLKETMNNPRLQFIYPRREVHPDGTDRDWERKSIPTHNARYEAIAQAHGMEVIPYYFVEARYNPDDVGQSTVIVTDSHVRVIGDRVVYDQEKKQWERVLRTQKDYD